MELAGTDRTTEHAADQARRSGKGVGSTKSVVDGANEVAEAEELDAQNQVQDLSNTSSDSSTSVEVAQKATLAQSNAKSQNTHASDIGRVGELSGNQSTSLAATSEPLGVPAGMVDEVDQIGEKHGQLTPLEPGSIAGGAKAFSSTTTTTTISASDAKDTLANENDVENEEEDGGRALKRVRSDRHLGSKADESEIAEDKR